MQSFKWKFPLLKKGLQNRVNKKIKKKFLLHSYNLNPNNLKQIKGKNLQFILCALWYMVDCPNKVSQIPKLQFVQFVQWWLFYRKTKPPLDRMVVISLISHLTKISKSSFLSKFLFARVAVTTWHGLSYDRGSGLGGSLKKCLIATKT